ncbi:hypothetical protein [Leuconostoc citreum]|uniref:hypothetical protein n=1 Tax=Leuconostoc citreum TaxID=33964 RepID=UPI0022E864C0|nr:hypothetical protein [Leuconostoc citreum]
MVDQQTDKKMLNKWAQAGTENNTKFILQINHSGKHTPRSMTKEPVAPSVIPMPKNLRTLFNTPRELSKTGG